MDIQAHALDILRSQFGFDGFRDPQLAIIEEVMAGRDCLVLMPTGGGKSLCYQVPALMQDGVTLVVSPLIALMKDQVDALQAHGIAAAFLNSSQSDAEQQAVYDDIVAGRLKLLYVAPERLMQEGFYTWLQQFAVALIAVDEAHCVSSWGHDFRPEYQQLHRLRRLFPDTPLMALTATADELVRADMLEFLGLGAARQFVASFNRPNIFYRVETKTQVMAQLLLFINEHRNESGIVYCLSRKAVEEVAAKLVESGIRALPYHAGLPAHERAAHQERFIDDDVHVMVATVAFGMGVDKPDVRFVVHYDLPKNLEAYYQETGRAGRDGLPSVAYMLYQPSDAVKLKRFIERDEGQGDEYTAVQYQKVNLMAQYASLRSCRRHFLLHYFGEESPERCEHCDNCAQAHVRFDGTVIAQKALSAVARTNQAMGLVYLVDFLRGSQSAKIREAHKQLRTYGIGRDISKEAWMTYFRDLIAQGFLQQSVGAYPIIQLTDRGVAVLKGEVTVMLYAIEEGLSTPKPAPASRIIDQVEHKVLFERLRQLRMNIAKEAHKAAFIIFSDRTLLELAHHMPQDLASMGRIHGIGEHKLQLYGELFVHEIVQYISEFQVTPNPQPLNLPMDEPSEPQVKAGSTHEESLRLFEDGLSIDAIAVQRGLAQSTIEGHLSRYLASGQVQITDLVPQDRRHAIEQAIAEELADHGHITTLSPIKKRLSEEISYGEIRSMLVYLGYWQADAS